MMAVVQFPPHGGIAPLALRLPTIPVPPQIIAFLSVLSAFLWLHSGGHSRYPNSRDVPHGATSVPIGVIAKKPVHSKA
jgi:hypothetical protein